MSSTGRLTGRLVAAGRALTALGSARGENRLEEDDEEVLLLLI